MSIGITTKVHCEHDKCRHEFDLGEGSKAYPREARKEARALGWTRVADADYCPDHKPTYKRVLVPAE